MAEDPIINTLVTVASGKDLRIKKAFGDLSSPVVHKQIGIFKETVF